MRTETLKYEERDLRGMCRTTIMLRVILVGAALSIIAFLKATGLDFRGMMPVVGLLLVVFPLSALWWMLFKSGYNLKRLIYGQLLADLAVEGAIVYFAGGVYGQLTVVFLITIFAAGVLLSLREALAAATVSTGLLTLTSVLREAHITETLGISPDGKAEIYFGLSIALQAAFFYLIALLSGYISRRVRSFGAELRTTATELRKARMDTNQIIESMNSGLVTIDMGGVITKMNEAASRILGVLPDAARGETVRGVLGGISPDMVTKMMRTLEDGIEEKRAEVHALNADRSVPLGVSVSQMTDHEGRRAGVVCVFQDLTEVKAMEEKIRVADRLAALGELSAGIAHEIKTPLASICGSVEMLRESLPEKGEDRKLVGLVVKESERLRNIIDHFLQFARSRSPRLGRVSLGVVLDEVMCMVRNHPSFTGEISLDLDVGEGATIMADEENIKQVFYNLAVNAIEALGSSGRLQVEVAPDIERNLKRFVRINFRDNGEGMDAETRAHAFRPFFTGKVNGTGLGLPIVSKIIEEHGGTIDIVSTRGKGTVVSVYLPCEIEAIDAGLCGAIPESGRIENSES